MLNILRNPQNVGQENQFQQVNLVIFNPIIGTQPQGELVQSGESNSRKEEDEVDQLLAKQDGLIDRPPDSRLCRHGTNAKCVHCAPIEPYNEAHLREHNIKHMSFHAYLRKITSGIDK